MSDDNNRTTTTAQVFEGSLPKIKKAQRILSFREDRDIKVPETLDKVLDRFLEAEKETEPQN
jgi:hypothetical protein